MIQIKPQISSSLSGEDISAEPNPAHVPIPVHSSFLIIHSKGWGRCAQDKECFLLFSNAFRPSQKKIKQPKNEFCKRKKLATP